jgi:hypothetical protein
MQMMMMVMMMVMQGSSLFDLLLNKGTDNEACKQDKTRPCVSAWQVGLRDSSAWRCSAGASARSLQRSPAAAAHSCPLVSSQALADSAQQKANTGAVYFTYSGKWNKTASRELVWCFLMIRKP